MKTKHSLLFLALSCLTACQSQPEANLLAQLPAVQRAWQVHLPGQAGASLAVQISPHQPSPAFVTQVSLPGAEEKQISDILAYRVFVVSSSTSPTGVLTPYASQVVTVSDNHAASQTIVFSNLPSGSFYACAAAFGHSSVFNADTNLTENLGALTTYAEGPIACSNIGGDSPGLPGQVRVDTNRQLLTSGVVGISLNLRSRRGATVDTRLLVHDGL